MVFEDSADVSIPPTVTFRLRPSLGSDGLHLPALYSLRNRDQVAVGKIGHLLFARSDSLGETARENFREHCFQFRPGAGAPAISQKTFRIDRCGEIDGDRVAAFPV